MKNNHNIGIGILVQYLKKILN